MRTIRITLDDTSITASQLAVWIRKVAGTEYNAKDALEIARSMIRGENWEPPYASVVHSIRNLKNAPWSYVLTDDKDEIMAYYRRRTAEYASNKELAERGAAGDTEASIKFCALWLTGVMNLTVTAG